jgi:RNA polymerase sigma factor (sigma-70 family)
MAERCNDIAKGSGSPVQAAFLKYERALKRVIARITRSHDAASDIAQDVFLRVLAAEQTTLIANAKAYIFEAARNAALTELTRRSRVVLAAVEDALNPVVPDSELSAEAVIMGQERLKLFCEAVDQLPPQCRTVFVMCKVQGKSHREIASSLGISESTIEKHVGTALARCAAYISRREQGPPQSVAVVAIGGRRMPR